jgi:hypothetical protein
MKVMEEDLDPPDTCGLPMIPHLVMSVTTRPQTELGVVDRHLNTSPTVLSLA